VVGCTPEQQRQDSSASMIQAKGQSAVNDPDSDPNLLGIALSSKDHTTLVVAAQAAAIEDVLVNAGPITLFAPTNAAFDKLPKETLEFLLKPENQGDLRNILYYHAAPGKYSLEDLRKEKSIYQANGGFVEITMEGDKVFANGSEILASIEASNGMVHVVGDVLLQK
jgi:uncharacterized surface protein with fasciclin (FAS1) repeats